jgi:phosphoglycolate phosphatase-like HAD superfamily hydrolase
MTGRPSVVLLDVDGTLVSAGGAGRRAIGLALGEVCGPVDGVVAAIRLDGMTDRLIVREALDALGRTFTDALCDDVLARYVGHLARELAAPGFAVLPGVEPLLGALAAGGRPYGLCTGNVEEGARQKLARGGLERYFAWGADAIGGFAHDGEARDRVVAAAVRRASARLGREVAPAEVLVVGDTPRDVEAAHRVGCPALAVATGRYDVEALAAAGADRVVPTLEHPDARAWLLD